MAYFSTFPLSSFSLPDSTFTQGGRSSCNLTSFRSKPPSAADQARSDATNSIRRKPLVSTSNKAQRTGLRTQKPAAAGRAERKPGPTQEMRGASALHTAAWNRWREIEWDLKGCRTLFAFMICLHNSSFNPLTHRSCTHPCMQSSPRGYFIECTECVWIYANRAFIARDRREHHAKSSSRAEHKKRNHWR